MLRTHLNWIFECKLAFFSTVLHVVSLVHGEEKHRVGQKIFGLFLFASWRERRRERCRCVCMQVKERERERECVCVFERMLPVVF